MDTNGQTQVHIHMYVYMYTHVYIYICNRVFCFVQKEVHNGAARFSRYLTFERTVISGF
jgi:hypothetical protein